MTKLKTAWERAKIFGYFIRAAWRRWTLPRVYVVQYAYTDKDGSMQYDAHVVRGCEFNLMDVVAYLQRSVKGKNLIILGMSEVPCAVYNGPVIDNARKFVNKVEQIADNLDLSAVKPQKSVDDDEEEEDDNF